MAKRNRPGFSNVSDGPEDEDDMRPRHMRDGEPGEGHNRGELGERITEVVEAIDEVQAELDARSEERKKQDAPLREKLKAIKKAAAEGGLQPAALNALMRERKLRRRAEEVGKNLDQELQETLNEYRAAMGDFAELPLGKAAAPLPPAKPSRAPKLAPVS